MKCENCWSWMETGGVARRLLARWHANRCPSCRQSLTRLEAIRRELAPDQSPSTAHRKSWQRGMAAEIPYPAWPKRRVAIAAALGMAAVLALAVGVWVTGLWPSAGRAPVAGGNRPTIEPKELPRMPQLVEASRDDESLRRIDAIKSSLLALSEELEQLSRNASLLEEREQVVQLLSDYEQR